MGGHRLERDDARLDELLVDARGVADIAAGSRARDARLSVKSGSRSTPRDSRASWMARAAYFRICTVSGPETSEKNQPQLVYMSSAWRCISSSLSARVISRSSRLRRACRSRNSAARLRSGSSTSSMNSSRARQGRRRGLDLLRSKTSARCPRRLSSASRSGCAPLLIPARLPAALAAAVTAPTLDAVRAAPARALDDLRLPGRRHMISSSCAGLTSSMSSRSRELRKAAASTSSAPFL